MGLRITIFTLLLALLLCGPAAAARGLRIETLEGKTPSGKSAANLVINGKQVASIAREQRGHSPMYNISLAAALIADAYRKGELRLSTKATDQSGQRHALYLNGELLLLATADEATAWDSESAVLVEQWQKLLSEALDIEALPSAAPAQSLPAPSNNATDVVPVQPATPAKSKSEPAAGAGTIDLGTSQGKHEPEYSGLPGRGGNNVYSPPEFTELSGVQVPSELTAQITGRKLVTREAERSVENAIRCYAGLPASAALSWKCSDLYAKDFSLAPGKSKRIEVSYSIGGSAGLAKTGKISVLLENRSISTPKESLTFFSNKPEGVRQKQLLYYATLPEGKAGRLVLHHQNQTSSDLQFVARVVNTGTAMAGLHVIEGMSPPNINTFYIGFKSAEEFWNNLNSGIGRVLAIPPGGQALIAEQKLPRGYTSSGYFKLTSLGGAPLLVETLALAPGTKLPDGPWPERSGASSSVFPEPQIVRNHNYKSGDPWLYMRLGDEKPGSHVDEELFHGCYGVTHSYNVELENTGNTPELFFVVLRASAGEVKGQFYIDDEYFVTPLVMGGEEFLLKEIPMRPGQTKLLKITALPLNGGFYPASIILRQSRYP